MNKLNLPRQCSKRFYSKQYLQRHIREVHEGVRELYTCDLCGFTHHRPEGLLDHKNKVHSTKYQCTECGNCYGDTYKLNVHMMKHSEPQFKCRYTRNHFIGAI